MALPAEFFCTSSAQKAHCPDFCVQCHPLVLPNYGILQTKHIIKKSGCCLLHWVLYFFIHNQHFQWISFITELLISNLPKHVQSEPKLTGWKNKGSHVNQILTPPKPHTHKNQCPALKPAALFVYLKHNLYCPFRRSVKWPGTAQCKAEGKNFTVSISKQQMSHELPVFRGEIPPVSIKVDLSFPVLRAC